MNKYLASGACALLLSLAAHQPAAAWVNWKGAGGVNFNWQSGGNNYFYGMLRDGQPPGPDPYCGLPHGGPGSHLGVSGAYPPPGQWFPSYGPQDFQYYGSQPKDQQRHDVGRQAYPNGPAPTPSNAAAGHGMPYGPLQFRPVSHHGYYFPGQYHGYGR